MCSSFYFLHNVLSSIQWP